MKIDLDLPGEWRPLLGSPIYCACGDPKCTTRIWLAESEDGGHNWLMVERADATIQIYLPDGVWPCMFYQKEEDSK